MLEDRAGKDVAFLAQNVKTFLDAARKRPELGTLIPTFLPNVPQVFVNVDRDKVHQAGNRSRPGLSDAADIHGRLFRELLQSLRPHLAGLHRGGRRLPRPTRRTSANFTSAIRTAIPVPLDAISTIENIAGPEFTLRYNEYRSAQINGSAAPGYSSYQAMNALEEIFRQTMPNEMGYDYLGMSYQEKKAQQGVSPTVVFGMSLIFVFLILAALYESWSLPFSVLLGTPVAVFGAFAHALAARNAKQYLRANWSDHANRPGREKRDPHRRICQGRIRKRQTAPRRRARRRALALAPDPDDFLCFHLRHVCRCGLPAAPAPSPAASSAQPSLAE